MGANNVIVSSYYSVELKLFVFSTQSVSVTEALKAFVKYQKLYKSRKLIHKIILNDNS